MSNILTQMEKNDDDIIFYLQKITQNLSNIKECIICYDTNISIDMYCGHEICIHCYCKINNCYYKCKKYNNHHIALSDSESESESESEANLEFEN